MIIEIILGIACIVLAILAIKMAIKDKQSRQEKTTADEPKPKPVQKVEPEVAFEISDMIFSPKRIPNRIAEDIEYADVDFEQEPDNPYDPKAVKVIYSDYEEDIVIGYLFKGCLQDKVNKYINESQAYKIRAYVSSIDEDSEDAKKFIEVTAKFYK